ncbi:histidine phosphatase superfamily [Thelonectria olida]|uniref:Histidine phosphatase superfamily n=1 Tax=Thelonectria olida TaxID=1576542 RepID=A0A9P8VRD0_9HYPO|nr:histidine phosphatase superfamily [Thelonectria olida]
MPVTEILIVRHGDRVQWTLNPISGVYSSTHPYPTGLPADPPLASNGVKQSKEVGIFLQNSLAEHAEQDRLRIYSSPFYRCLETLGPTIEALIETTPGNSATKKSLQVRGERGIGEWFALTWFIQPKPEELNRLRDGFFPWLDGTYQSKMAPPAHGETIVSLHNRVAQALAMVIEDVDREYEQAGRGDEEVTLLLCAHAATIIATGRALTGQLPNDYNEDELKCYTCGISKFIRKSIPPTGEAYYNDDWWKRRGVAGGWELSLNSDCGHLSQGEENGWRFNGDEAFDSYQAPPTLGSKIAV